MQQIAIGFSQHGGEGAPSLRNHHTTVIRLRKLDLQNHRTTVTTEIAIRSKTALMNAEQSICKVFANTMSISDQIAIGGRGGSPPSGTTVPPSMWTTMVVVCSPLQNHRTTPPPPE